MSTGLDLNELRDTVLDNQYHGDALPSDRNEKVFVDREGNITLGEDVQPGDELRLSQVHQSTFAATCQCAQCQRVNRESQIVASKLPRGTRWVSVGGRNGWLYAIRSELGDAYSLFAYYDGSRYQVKLVSPQLAGRYGVHDAHLFSDGRLCLTQEGGLATLELAYGKSALWATGMSVYQRTGRFPFSRNNQ